eukprot:11087025-Lingulodinium_polyedra.AAC.1
MQSGNLAAPDSTTDPPGARPGRRQRPLQLLVVREQTGKGRGVGANSHAARGPGGPTAAWSP